MEAAQVDPEAFFFQPALVEKGMVKSQTHPFSSHIIFERYLEFRRKLKASAGGVGSSRAAGGGKQTRSQSSRSVCFMHAHTYTNKLELGNQVTCFSLTKTSTLARYSFI